MWDFIIWVMCERECVKTQDKLKIKGVFAGNSQEDFLRSEAICLAHDRNMKSHDSWFLRLFRG